MLPPKRQFSFLVQKKENRNDSALMCHTILIFTVTTRLQEENQ